MEGESEITMSCPYCFQPITMLVETYYPGQEYIEDCEVCCGPISLRYEVHEGVVSEVQARKLSE